MMISRGMVYGKELDELVWRERERWCIRGFIMGAVFAHLVWTIIVSF